MRGTRVKELRSQMAETHKVIFKRMPTKGEFRKLKKMYIFERTRPAAKRVPKEKK